MSARRATTISLFAAFYKMTEKIWRGMFFISWPLYASNVCHSTLRLLLLWCLVGEVFSKVLWPSGRYGLPMPKSGCPKTNGFYWNTGYILQDLEDTNSKTSVSPNSHLLGWVSNDVVRYFCIKNNASAAVDSKRFRWPAGEYCIYQRGSRCPTGLQSGRVLWDDEDSATGTNKNSHAGVLPAGVYNQDTEIFFCCQSTGSHDNPIELPVASPFYLIAFRSECQEVLNTIHTLEYVVYDTENDNNHDQKRFPYPYGVSFQEPTIYYCYYEECAWTMTALTGTFWSPYYPLDYKNHASCKWQITVPSNYIISVNFEDVTLERACCRCDYVEVWETLNNGSAVLVTKFCDDIKPDPSQQFRSTSNSVTVIFRSDATVREKGFKASYQAIPVPVVTTTSTIAITTDSNDALRTTTISSHVTTVPQKVSSTTSNVVTTQLTKQDDSTTMVTMAATIASTTNNHETRRTTTLSIEKNDTTTISFGNISTRIRITERGTTARSSDLATEISTIEVTSEQRPPPTELGKSTSTNREGVQEARNGSTSKGRVLVIVGVIASLIVIGGVVVGTLFWFCKKRNIKRGHNNRSTLAVSFTSAEKAVDITDTSSLDMYQGSHQHQNNDWWRSPMNLWLVNTLFTVATDTDKESGNPLYERECLGIAAKDGFNDEMKESENPLYASSVETVKESENPMYESMDDVGKGTVQDDIYSLVYERMI